MSATIPVIFDPSETIEEVSSRLAQQGLRISGRWNGQVEAVQIKPINLISRLASTKKALGAKLICHPAYEFNPRHSNNPDIYQPARAAYIKQVEQAANADRLKNPAFIRANAIRTTLSGVSA